MRDEVIGPVRNLVGTQATGTAVVKKIPVRSRAQNFGGTLAFIVAVVPLGEVGALFGRRIQAGQLSGARGTLERTDRHMGKRNAAQACAHGARRRFTVGGQWNVGAAGVPTGEGPRGLAVADQKNEEGHFVRMGGGG